MAVQAGPCPNCGSTIEFRAGSSLSLVCKYCQHVVVRTDRDLKNLGKVADVASSDAALSPGDSGTFRGRSFTVEGRLVLKHPAGGTWEEYYAVFDGRNPAWISEAQGFWQVVTAAPVAAPPLGTLHPQTQVPLGDHGIFVVGETNEGTFISGEGELPFAAAPGTKRLFVDLSAAGGGWASIDYGDGTATPQVFVGVQTSFAELQIRERGGDRPVAKVATKAITCAGCGAPLPVLSPGTERAACVHCNALNDVKLQQVVARQGQAREQPSIQLGRKGVLPVPDARGVNNAEWIVLGYVERSTGAPMSDDWFGWQEYLLYNVQHGYRWLVFDEGMFYFITPLAAGDIDASRAPTFVRKSNIHYRQRNAQTARVDFVLGEFYWKVEVGETVWAEDYENGRELVSSEKNENEISWSFGVVVNTAIVTEAFGYQPKASSYGESAPAYAPTGGSSVSPGLIIAIIIIVFLVFGMAACGSCLEGAGGGGGGVRGVGGSSSGGFGGSSRGADPRARPMGQLLLYATVVLVATCGLVYELVAGAVSTYLLGDSVTQLSTVIGVHLSAMGVGAWLSKYVEDRVAERFIDTQIAASFVGGLGGPVLYLTFAQSSHVRLVLYLLVASTGVLVGAELPLLMRVLKRRVAFKDVVPRVLSLDYAGALLGALVFALLLLPSLGILRTGIVFGILGVASGLWGTWVLGSSLEARPLRVRGVFALVVLGGALAASQTIVLVADEALLLHPVAYTKQTQYQRIVLTQARSGVSLFLDGNLQFASIDEYRYHEALVHPAFAVAKKKENVLVLGGGDGLAVREILRHPEVKSVTLVDLDRGMTDLARELPLLRDLNERSFFDPRVRVVNDDAMVWITEDHEGIPKKFDVVIVDFPDPNNFALGKLYTVRFYRLLRERLADEGVISVQSTSPLVARRSFWCVVRSIEAAGFVARPYHALVPSFGEWGYVLAGKTELPLPAHVPGGLKYLTDATVASLFDLAPDMSAVPVEVNRLNNQMLVRYYEEEWQRWAR